MALSRRPIGRRRRTLWRAFGRTDSWQRVFRGPASPAETGRQRRPWQHRCLSCHVIRPPASSRAANIALLEPRPRLIDAHCYDSLAVQTRDKAGAMAASPGSGESALVDTLAASTKRSHSLEKDEYPGGMSDITLNKIAHEMVTLVGWGRHFATSDRSQDLLRLQVTEGLRPDAGLEGIRRATTSAELLCSASEPL